MTINENPPPNAAEYNEMRRRLALLDDHRIVPLRMEWKPDEQNQTLLLGGVPIAQVKQLTNNWYAIPEGRWPIPYTIACENRDEAMRALENSVRTLAPGALR